MKEKIANFFTTENMIYLTVALVIIIILLIALRIYNLKTISKDKTEVIQAAEIHPKKIITRDQYELQLWKQLHEKSKVIVIGIHDLQGQKDDFKVLSNYCKQQNWSILAYDRRGEGKNFKEWKFKTFATDINDCKDVIKAVNLKFPSYQIILWGEGLGASIACLAAQNNQLVHSVITTNLITKHYLSTFSLSIIIRFFLGFLFNSNIHIPLYIDPKDISSNITYITNVNQRYSQKQIWTFKYFMQIKTLNKKAFKKLPKLAQPTLIIQSADDVFSDFHQLKILRSKLKQNHNYHFIYSGKHALINEPETKDLFNKEVLAWINNEIINKTIV